MTPTQINKLKREFIEQRQDFMKGKVTELQKKLYDKIFDKIISQLVTSGGVITDDGKNIELSTAIDKIFKEFNSNEFLPIIKLFGKDLLKIGKLNNDYFQVASGKHLDEVKKVGIKAEEKLNKQLGIEKDGKLTNKSYLDKLIKDTKLRDEIKKETVKAITNKKPVGELILELQKKIEGNAKVDGGLKRYFDQNMRDTYNTFDAQSSSLYASGLGMQAFVYQGGKIKSSRCFCIAKDNQVFTIEEAKQWEAGTNDECRPIWNEKTDGKYNYTMRGGYECRHSLDFISNKLAILKRPDLKFVLEG